MNADIIKGKWKEIKGDLRSTWGDVTDDEWEKTKGDTTAIVGILQKKYGLAKEEASKKFAKLMESYTSSVRDGLGKTEEKLK